jgi:hypothetical protein
MINSYDEIDLFRSLRKTLRQDLVSCHGFSNPDAGKILNWFDPASGEYLEHVDSWQKALCAGAVSDCIPLPVFHHNAFGTYDLFSAPIHQIGAIHQVAKLVYKWHGVPRKETNMNEVAQRLRDPLPITLEQFEIDGIRQCLKDIEPPDLNCAIGRFGPGSTYEGFRADEKWRRIGGIPDVPPSFFRPSPRDPWTPSFYMDGETKIAEVPKSIKCNRIVSSEPAMYMYAQLAVADDLVGQMHMRFCGSISLNDQTRHNEALYRDGACSIDLSDASDHVSVDFVQAVLPQLWPVLAKVRSTRSRFPDGSTIVLGTFAPMGSGVCFPVLTLVVAGIFEYAKRVVERERHIRCWWKAYGDDGIVPVWMYDIACDLLARAGLVVNKSKSCCTLHYVESCGLELFDGCDITPCYVRDPLDQVDAAKVEQIASRLDQRAFPHTARAIADASSAARSFRYNKNLQRLEVCVRTTSARQKIRSLDGWDGLNRWFSVGTQGNAWDSHQPTGVAREVWTKTAWRYKSCWDYPYLTTWLVTKSKS